MDISTADVKSLRDETGISIMQCKKALEEAGGDMEKALVLLQKKRTEAAEKKSDRELGAGTVGVYLHNTNEVGAMVLLSCETDFVAKNDEFTTLARDIAMHVAAVNPTYVSRENVPEAEITRVTEVLKTEVADKPADKQAQILEGKLDAYYKEQILLEQSFIKNPETTIGEMIKAAVQKFGENVSVTDISRLSAK